MDGSTQVSSLLRKMKSRPVEMMVVKVRHLCASF